MNDKTIVSKPGEKGLQLTVATSYVVDQVLKDAVKYGGLRGVPPELLDELKRGLDGHFVTPEPVLQALLKRLVGHPELWAKPGRLFEANVINNRKLVYIPGKPRETGRPRPPLAVRLLPYLLAALGAATLIMAILATRVR